MNPKIDNLFQDNDTLQFTLSNIDVSVANTLRRTILSDIQTCVFKTSPYEESDADIEINTTTFNNEILKQRLSCIPIHITDSEFPIENFLLVVDEDNKTNTIQFVTTEHFQLYDTITKTFMPEKERKKIFPMNAQTEQYIDFARLRPKISDEIPGERLKLTCKISRACGKDDYMFNSACTSTYGYTPDKSKIDDVWNKKESELKKDEGVSSDDLEYMKKDWYNLDAKRIYIPNSFDFTIQTVGVYGVYTLIKLACQFITKTFDEFRKSEYIVNTSESTMENAYDIVMYDKDHTFGKCMEYLFHEKFFKDEAVLTYCGFLKRHPHDDYCILRIAYKSDVGEDVVKKHIDAACEDGSELFKSMEQLFIE